MPITSVSAVGLVGGFCLNPADSGFSWWLWRDPAAAGFRRTRETLCDLQKTNSVILIDFVRKSQN